MRTKANPIGRTVHSFEMYPSTPISRSKFDRSHSLLTSLNSGYLVPIYHDEALPGDTLIMSCRGFARLATQIVPFMDNVYMDVHFWSVPNRLLWEHWEAMNGDQPNPGDSTDYLTPQISVTNVEVGSIYDYFGIPTGLPNALSFNAFNFRAYNLVYNEWYRDENLIERVPHIVSDTDSYENYTLLKRGKRKDYFTGALPSPQKGPGVELPLGSVAPVVPVDSSSTDINVLTGSSPTNVNMYFPQNQLSAFRYGSIATKSTSDTTLVSTAGGLQTVNPTNKTNLKVEPLQVDLSDASAATINSLRQAFAIQRMFEKDARGGTRYTEMILSHFGVKSPDARMQRPEFLGGATFNLNLSVVPQTSSTNGTTPQANLSSFGTIQGESGRIVHSFTEHCTVIGLVSIRADYTYQQGLERSYSRRQRIDYYLPTLANLGEQAVLNKEIYAQGTDSDDEVFGYQERWSEYRYKQNFITGQLRSQAPQSLDIWHLAQDFASLPQLNEEFINENPPISRVIAVTGDNTPEFIANFYFDEKWVRPMPVYSIPSLSSHF